MTLFGCNNLNMLNLSGAYQYGNIGGCLGGYGNMGSIFGMMGGYCSPFYDCNGIANYDAIAGYEIANTTLNLIGNKIGEAVAQRRERKAAEEQAVIDTNNSVKEAKNNIKASENELKTLEKNIEDAKTNKEKAQTQLTTVTTKLNELAERENIPEGEEGALKGTEKIELENLRKEYNQLLEDLKADGKYDKAIKEAEEARAAKVKEIENTKAELKELEAEQQKAQDVLDNRALEKANGNKLTRNEELDVTKFEEKGYTGELKRADLNQLVWLFQNAEDDNQKKEYAKAITNIDLTVYQKVSNKSHDEVRKIATEWLKNNP